MRYMTLITLALLVAVCVPALAELQNVEVGGSLRIRGNVFEMDKAWTMTDTAFTEMRTRLSVKADFTDQVSAFIELDSYDIWGEDFRSANYVTGLDARAASGNDVEMYQAYIDAQKLWGTDLSARIGRQEIKLGSGWLVGTNDANSFFTGLSFDAIRLDYATDMFSVTALDAKLAETLGDFGDDDADLYAIYASYLGFEDITIDAYWMYVKDDVALIGTESDLHTVGLRGAGKVGAFDFEAEAAYQFGEAKFPDTKFLWWTVDDNDVDYDAWACNLEAGYTFDVSYQPRVFLGFAYLEGAGDDSLAFNRLFSDWEYSQFLDTSGDMSNMFVYRAGVSAMPTESIKLALNVSYLVADEVDSGGWWFWSWKNDDTMGWEAGLSGSYQYSEDLGFRAGWSHFFGDDGVNDGNDIWANGLAPWFGSSSDDYDYIFAETQIKF